MADVGAEAADLVADEESAILALLLDQARAAMERGDDVPRLYREQLSIVDRVLRYLTRRSRALMAVATRSVRRALARSDENDLASVGASLSDLPRGVRSDLARSADATLVGVRDIVRRDNLDMADGARRLWTDSVARAVSAYNSGSVTLDRAMRAVATELGRRGISIVDYRSGVRTGVEAAIRRHLRTQLSQAAGRRTMETCRAIGCELVEVTRTAVPRPSHARWEGRIYRITDTRDDYPDLWEGTGYEGLRGPYTALGDRLMGVNCGHSFGPYRDWMEPRWADDPRTDEEKEERYRLTQRQRRYEREVRRAKREASLLQSRGMDASAERARMGRYQAKLRALVGEHGGLLRREPSREWVPTPSGRQPVALTSPHVSLASFMGRDSTRERIAKAGVSKTAVRAILAKRPKAFGRTTQEADRQKALTNAIAIARSRKVGLYAPKSLEHVVGTREHANRVARGETPGVFPEGTTLEELEDVARRLIGHGVIHQNREVVRTDDGSTPGLWWDEESGVYVPTDRYTIHYSPTRGYHLVPSRPSWLLGGREGRA